MIPFINKGSKTENDKTNNDVIIVHASTSNVAKTTPHELCKEVMETLEQIQKNNPRSKFAFSAAFRRSDHIN